MLDLLEFNPDECATSSRPTRPPEPIEIDHRTGARVNKNDLAIRREGYHPPLGACSSRNAINAVAELPATIDP